MSSYTADASVLQDSDGAEAFQWKVRVRYAETDRMGRAYHGAFVPWLEVARVEWLRHRGISYAALEQEGWLLPVTRCEIRYLKPVPYDAEVVLRVHADVGGVRLIFRYVLEVEHEVVATAEVELASVDAATGRPKRWKH